MESNREAAPINPLSAPGIFLLILGALLLQLVGLVIIVPLVRKRFVGLPSSLLRALRSDQDGSAINDTAFVLMQQKLYKEAHQLLQKWIAAHGADPLSLANYALAIGLSGDVDGAERRLRAAGWWAKSARERAVVSFNRATLFLANGELGPAKEHLRAALWTEPKEIRRYAELNAYLSEAAARDPEILEMISPQKKQA